MNKEQISNWRRVLTLTMGPYAFIIPDSEIIKMRDDMQRKVDSLTKSFDNIPHVNTRVVEPFEYTVGRVKMDKPKETLTYNPFANLKKKE